MAILQSGGNAALYFFPADSGQAAASLKQALDGQVGGGLISALQAALQDSGSTVSLRA